jgi:hypothetical protein
MFLFQSPPLSVPFSYFPSSSSLPVIIETTSAPIEKAFREQGKKNQKRKNHFGFRPQDVYFINTLAGAGYIELGLVRVG